MGIISDTGMLCGVIMAIAFIVSLIVQFTKGFIPLPTKLWCIMVSAIVMIMTLFTASSNGYVELNGASICLSVVGSFVVAFVAENGFNTFKDLWRRFSEGEDIDEDK